MTPIEALDYGGVALFAATGALAASRNQLDIVGFVFLGAVTGIGGGTVRDLVLGVPVFWVEEPRYVLVCTLAAVMVYFTAHLIESRARLILWLDALALAAYGVFGAHKGLMETQSATIAIVMGMMTGTLGGIIRDIIANEASVLLRREIYVAAAICGAAVFVALLGAGAPVSLAAALGFLMALVLRGGAIQFHWRLPAYRSRPGRPPREPR